MSRSPGRLRRAVAALTTSLLAGALVVAVPVAAHADSVAPTVTITSASTTSTAVPTITGTYDSGTYDFPGGGSARGPLNIYDGETLICQVYSTSLTAAAGTYSCTLWSSLAPGVTNIQAQLMDGTKTLPVAVADQALTYTPASPGPVTPPTVPVTPPTTSTPPVPTPSVLITSPATATSASPTLSGTITVGTWASEPRSVFEVYVGSELVCTSSLSNSALSGGTWTCEVGALDPGEYDVFVRILKDVKDSSANYSTAAQTLVVPTVVDPTTPSITITSSPSATSNSPTFTGTFSTGEEESKHFTMWVIVDDAPVCDASSTYLDFVAKTWSCTSDTTLNSGKHSVAAELLYKGFSYSDLWPSTVATQALTVPVTGTITGHVFNDANGNGIQDAGEPDISGVRVELWQMNESDTFDFYASTVTRSPYVFRSVPLGTYQVRVPAGTAPAGFVGLASAAVWTVTVTGGGTFSAPTGSFGFTPVTAQLAYTGADSSGVIHVALGLVMIGLLLAAASKTVRRRDLLQA